MHFQQCHARIVAVGKHRTGAAYVRPAMLVAFLSYFVVSLPLAYVFGISIDGGLVGVWFSFPFGLTIAGLLYYHFYHRRLLQLEANMD